MEKVYFVGLDIAKNVFQVFLADQRGRDLVTENYPGSS